MTSYTGIPLAACADGARNPSITATGVRTVVAVAMGTTTRDLRIQLTFQRWFLIPDVLVVPRSRGWQVRSLFTEETGLVTGHDGAFARRDRPS
jgi:hypothetical protein